MIPKISEWCGGGSELRNPGIGCSPGNIPKDQSIDGASNCMAWCRRGARRAGYFGVGIALVVLGLIWLGAIVGWFQSAFIWPVAMTIFGVWLLLLNVICGIPMISLGLLWLGEALGWLQPDYFWPLFVAIIGLLIIVAGLAKRRRRS